MESYYDEFTPSSLWVWLIHPLGLCCQWGQTSQALCFLCLLWIPISMPAHGMPPQQTCRDMGHPSWHAWSKWGYQEWENTQTRIWVRDEITSFLYQHYIRFPSSYLPELVLICPSLCTHAHTALAARPLFPFGGRRVAELPDTHSQLPRSPTTATVHQFSHSSPTTSCNNHFQILLRNVLLCLSMQLIQPQALEGNFFLTWGIIASNFPCWHFYSLGQKDVFVCYVHTSSSFINIKILIKITFMFFQTISTKKCFLCPLTLISKTLFLWCIKNHLQH